jgi:hypothetical protein
MDEALRKQWMMVQQDQQISEAIEPGKASAAQLHS